MKTINLKNHLSKFVGHNIRVEGKMQLISKPVPNKPRTVLLTDLSIDGQQTDEHMWVPYSKQWEDYSYKHRQQKFTFVTKVVKIQKGPMTKYAFGKISKLELVATFKNPNKKKPTEVVKELINPDTAKLLPLLSAAGKVKLPITATAISMTNEATSMLKATNVTVNNICFETLDIPLRESQVEQFKNNLPIQFTADTTFQSDLFKVLPYQPVRATRMKNLKLQKEI